MAVFGTLDEFRHTQIPLLLFHQLVRWDPQFDWAHKFYHTNNWFAIAPRHFIDELTIGTYLFCGCFPYSANFQEIETNVS
jgi:hypothetical protein